MTNDSSTPPDRREFMRGMGRAAVYGAPVVALLGATKPSSNPDEIIKHFHEAAVHLNAAYRLGEEYRFSEREMEQLRPVLEELVPPIRAFPPKWCTVC